LEEEGKLQVKRTNSSPSSASTDKVNAENETSDRVQPPGHSFVVCISLNVLVAIAKATDPPTLDFNVWEPATEISGNSIGEDTLRK
jgi:hypothetical protein